MWIVTVVMVTIGDGPVVVRRAPKPCAHMHGDAIVHTVMTVAEMR